MNERNRGAQLWKLAIGFFVAATLAACAHQSTSRMDVESLLNAISIDDAGYVRSVVASGAASADGSTPNVSNIV